MKRITYIITVLLLSFGLAGVLKAEGSKGIALALKVEGKVKLTRDGKTTKLAFGTVLHHDDVVTTGEKGFATLIFTDDKSLLKLTSNTKVTIQGKRDDDGNITKRVAMDIGNLYAKVTKQRGTLEIATPTSVASVKGTQFWVVVDENGNSHVTTLEGLVELMNSLNGQIVEVRQGQRGEIDENGNLVVVDVPRDQLQGDPDPDGDDANRRSVEIDFADDDGNIRTIRVEFIEKGDEENGGGE